MQNDAFLGRSYAKQNAPVPQELAVVQNIKELEHIPELSTYFEQPAMPGIRTIQDGFEVVMTGTTNYVHDVLVPGAYTIRLKAAFNTKDLKKYSIAPATLLLQANPTRIILEALAKDYAGVYFRSSYGGYHRKNSVYYADSVNTGLFTVFAIEFSTPHTSFYSGMVENELVLCELPNGLVDKGSQVKLSWLGFNAHGMLAYPWVHL